MNTNETIARAQQQAEWLNGLINRHGYNWLPIIEFITTHDDPHNIAKSLQTIYFDYSACIFENPNDVVPPGLSRCMLDLRWLMEALGEMEEKTDFTTAISIDVQQVCK